jgi:multidrug efflux system membrane fusion protein
LKAAEASLAAAESDLRSAILELEHTSIKAPYRWGLEERYVELGSHLEKGNKTTLIIDESIPKAVGRVSQQGVGSLNLGQLVRVRLLNGRDAQGEITYISRLGNSETHSFRVEAEVPNTEGQLNAGVSAQLRIMIGSVSAHFLSPALLSLSNDGYNACGVRTLAFLAGTSR